MIPKKLEAARAALRSGLTALDSAATAIDRACDFCARAGRRDVAVQQLERLARDVRSARDLAELKGAKVEATDDEE